MRLYSRLLTLIRTAIVILDNNMRTMPDTALESSPSTVVLLTAYSEGGRFAVNGRLWKQCLASATTK